MTAVSSSDIPWAKITTLEQLHVWCATVLNDLNTPAKTFQERPGSSEVAIQAGTTQFYEGVDAGWYYQSRTTVKLASTWQRAGQAYRSAQELSTATIPTEYRT